MKYTILLLASILMIGCNSEKETENQTEELKTAYDVEYPSLTEENGLYYNGTELFTGKAGKKNSSDELVIYAEFKNGYLTHKKQWTDFGGKMELTHEMDYKDGVYHDGWYNYIEDQRSIVITKSYNVWKNGKQDKENSWVIGGNDYDGSYLLMPSNSTKQIKDLPCSTGKGTNVIYYINYGWDNNNENLNEFLKCIENLNLKNFHYHIN